MSNTTNFKKWIDTLTPEDFKALVNLNSPYTFRFALGCDKCPRQGICKGPDAVNQCFDMFEKWANTEASNGNS